MQNFNWETGKENWAYYVDFPIIKVDWNLESDIGPILAIATIDGMIKVLGTQELNLIMEFNIKDSFSENIPDITALCWNLERKLVVGFMNGATMSYSLKEVKQDHLFIGQGFFDDLESAPPVEQIKSSIIDRLIFISYADYWETNNKIKRLEKSLILIFDFDTADYQRQAYLPKMSIANIGVLEEKKLLILMARGENSIFILDYTECKGIAKLGNLPSSQMFACPITKSMWDPDTKLPGKALPSADALLFTSMDDGNIVSGLIKTSKENEELQATWVPQFLYHTKMGSKDADPASVKILNSIWYNIILDILIVADVTGVVYYTLSKNIETSIKSNMNEPFFSIGLSSSSKQSHITKLIGASPDFDKDGSSAKPLFSFGFFKKKVVEQPVEKSPKKVEEEKAAPSNVKASAGSSNTAGQGKRVQINKDDILSGNYSFTKPTSKDVKAKPKTKVDEDKINEVLKRIERHTTKPKETSAPVATFTPTPTSLTTEKSESKSSDDPKSQTFKKANLDDLINRIKQDQANDANNEDVDTESEHKSSGLLDDDSDTSPPFTNVHNTKADGTSYVADPNDDEDEHAI